MMPIEVVLHINDYCVGSISLVLNVVLLFAIVAHSNSSYGVYRYVLGFNAAFDAAYSFVVICTQMAYVINDNNLLLVAMGPIKYLGSTICSIFLQIYCNMTVMTYLIVPSIYVYRYLIIIRKLPSHQHGLFSLLILVCVFACVIPTTICFAKIIPSDEEYVRLFHYADQVFGSDPNERRVFMGGNVKTDFYIWLLLLVVTIEIVIAYLTAFFCARAVVKHWRMQQTHLLKKTREMQRNLSWILVIQTVGPFFLCAIPIMIVIVNIVRGTDMGPVSVLMSASFTWVPPANAVVSLYFLKPYREWILSRTGVYKAKQPNPVGIFNATSGTDRTT